MKWLRIIFAAFLVVGMLLGVSSVAYADDPPEGEPGIEVDITVVGDNPKVNTDVLGENSQVTVNTSGTEVWINGQNLNNLGGSSGIIGPHGNFGELLGYAEDPYARNKIGEFILPWIEEATTRVDLVTDGLAKIILLAQENESVLDTLGSLFESHDERQTALESETASLGERVDALEAQDAAIQAQITAKVNYLTASYNRILIIIIGAFSLVVIGLGTGLFLLWRRTRISLPRT